MNLIKIKPEGSKDELNYFVLMSQAIAVAGLYCINKTESKRTSENFG